MRNGSRTPLVIGAVVAVVLVVIAAVLVVALSGGDESAGDEPRTPVDTTTAAPVDSVTYEISGTAPAPLDVNYAGPDGKDVSITVSELPWSITVDPAPDFISIFALSTDIGAEPDITLTLKRGADVLRSCEGGGPCLMPFPS